MTGEFEWYWEQVGEVLGEGTLSEEMGTTDSLKSRHWPHTEEQSRALDPIVRQDPLFYV